MALQWKHQLKSPSLLALFLLLMLSIPIAGTAREDQARTRRFPSCPISLNYAEPDLLTDILAGDPYNEAYVLLDFSHNRIRILSDSQGNDAQHQWLENTNALSEPANPYFSFWRYGNALVVESQSYGLRSVEPVACFCSLAISAAPDAFSLQSSCPSIQFTGYKLFHVTYSP